MIRLTLRSRPRVAALVMLALSGFLAPGRALAQLHAPCPSLYAIHPVGMERGSHTQVKILSGLLSEGATGLVFSHPGITAKPVMREADKFYPEPRAIENTFEISVADDVPFGIYDVRAVYTFGISNARKFVVDRLPTSVKQIQRDGSTGPEISVGGDIAVYGALQPATEDRYQIQGRAGDTLIIDCQAERLDSRADATLVIENADGQELARAHDSVGRDPWIAFSPPADGKYTIRVFDQVYGNYKEQGHASYRLSITSGPWLRSIEPAVAERGKSVQFTLYGWNLGSGAERVEIDGQKLEKRTVTIDVPADPEQPASAELVVRAATATVDSWLYRYKTTGGTSNPLRLTLVDGPIVAEVEPNDNPDGVQAVNIPCNIVGRFDRNGDKDWYEFEARKLDRLWIEVVSQRLDQTTDPLLVVQQVIENGSGEISYRDVTVQDDQPASMQNLPFRLESDDPSYVFTAAADGKYRVLVRNQAESLAGGPRPAYQLTIRPARPDFRLVALADLPILNNNNDRPIVAPRAGIVRRGGAAEVIVVALRREGFKGEIHLTAKSLPNGVSAAPAIIAAESGATAMLLRAAADAPAAMSIVEITGQAEIDGQPRTHTASGMEVVWQVDNAITPARLSRGVSVAVDPTIEAPGRIEPVEQKVWRTARGGRLEIPVRLVPKSGEGKPGNLNASVAGLPENVRASNLNVEPGKESKLQIEFETTAPSGQFTCFLRAEMQQDYRRNPERAEQAKQDRERIAKLAKEASDASSKANQERQAASQAQDRAQQQTNEAGTQRIRSREKMKQTVQLAEAAALKATELQKSADEAVRRAEAGASEAAAAQNDAKPAAQQRANELKQQAEEAKRKAAQAQQQSEEIKKQATADEEKFKQDEEAFKAAQAKQTAAEKASQEAQAKEDQARKELAEANSVAQENDQTARRATDAAQPQKIRVHAHSDPIVIEVAPYALQFNFSPAQLRGAAGSELDLVANVVREFDCQEEISLDLNLPSGASGIRLKSDKIPKGANQAKLGLAIDKNAKPGTYEATLISRYRFNNRGIDQRMPIQVVVE